MRNQFVGDDGRITIAVITQQYVAKADGAGREQRNRDVAAQDRIESGYGVDLPDNRVAHGRGGYEKR